MPPQEEGQPAWLLQVKTQIRKNIGRLIKGVNLLIKMHNIAYSFKPSMAKNFD